jgi:tRNA pseudouridine38-40 synthase
MGHHDCACFVQASGRTDSGVHAKRQYVQFFIDRELEKVDALHLRMNSLLPHDLRVMSVRQVPSTFSVRYNALAREYHYHLQFGRVWDPLQHRFEGFVPGELDVAAMEEVAACFVGTHDFQAFSNLETDAKTHERTIYSAKLVKLADGHIRFEVRGLTISTLGVSCAYALLVSCLCTQL